MSICLHYHESAARNITYEILPSDVIHTDAISLVHAIRERGSVLYLGMAKES